MPRLKKLVIAGLIAFIPSHVFAQASDPTSTRSAQSSGAGPVEATLATPTGHEVNFSVGGYNYVEPGDADISIHGPKFGGEYAGTMSLNAGRHWFLTADARALTGHTTYDGWCSPLLITPDNTSPNGYALDIGDRSPCSESGDKDWYVEGRALVGKDFIGGKWGWSPDIGLGVRHLSNGTTGISGYRTDDYLYLPIGRHHCIREVLADGRPGTSTLPRRAVAERRNLTECSNATEANLLVELGRAIPRRASASGGEIVDERGSAVGDPGSCRSAISHRQARDTSRARSFRA